MILNFELYTMLLLSVLLLCTVSVAEIDNITNITPCQSDINIESYYPDSQGGEHYSGTLGLCNHIVTVIGQSVQGYFRTFTECWQLTGDWLKVMIDHYISFLHYLVGCFTEWILTTIPPAVSGYFETFRYCWRLIGGWLTYMIIHYLDLLRYLIGCFTEWILNTIPLAVSGYFQTFRYCWRLTGGWLTDMIDNYIRFLGHLVDRLTSQVAIVPLSIVAIAAMITGYKMLQLALNFILGLLRR